MASFGSHISYNGKAMLSERWGVNYLLQNVICAFLILCCLINGFGVHCNSQDEENPITITHKIDDDAEFTCSVKNLGRRKLIWRRLSDPYPISIGSVRFAPDRRYKAEKLSTSSYKLTIFDVSAKDAGEYECRVAGEEDLAEVITLNVKSGPNRPYLNPTETEIKAEEGDTVLLPCEVSNLENKLVLWRNAKNRVVTLRKRTFIGDKRFRLVHKTAPQWSLQIVNVKDDDFGHYTCIINSNPVLTRTVHLRRTVAPDTPPRLLKDTLYRVEIGAKEGDDVNMTCNFQGKPRPQVSWYRREMVGGESKKRDLGEGNILTLRSVRGDQSGTYFCVGKNGLKPYGRGRTRLLVQVPTTTVPPTTTTTVLVPTGPVAPHMYHVDGPRVLGKYGRDVILSCTAIGQPRPDISWHFKGHKLQNNHKYEITFQSSGRYNKTSELRVHSASYRDFGMYKCDGFNQLGLATLDIELYAENRRG